MFIQIFQLRFEVFDQFLSFQFPAGTEEAILDWEQIGMEIDLFDFFIVGKLCLFPQHWYFIPNEFLDLPVTAECCKGVARDPPPVRPVLDCCLSRDHHGDNAGLEGTSVDKTLSNVPTWGVDPLNVLWGHIFSIGQLENLLLREGVKKKYYKYASFSFTKGRNMQIFKN